jgi:IS30 family transposase
LQRRTHGCTANAALKGFTRQMKRLPGVLRKSMTYDRGSEMACHTQLARLLKIDIWFCDPQARRPRGSNENTNGQLAPGLPQEHRPWAPSVRPN